VEQVDMEVMNATIEICIPVAVWTYVDGGRGFYFQKLGVDL
jgi:hypothetical protein